MGGGSILSVNTDPTSNNQDSTSNGGSTKTVQLTQSSLS